jgi:hypothetical protein
VVKSGKKELFSSPLRHKINRCSNS